MTESQQRRPTSNPMREARAQLSEGGDPPRYTAVHVSTCARLIPIGQSARVQTKFVEPCSVFVQLALNLGLWVLAQRTLVQHGCRR